VADTGPGIPEEKRQRLFTPFERLGAEQTDVEGTGLGLALSQRLTEAMGGAMGVHSVVGEGSTFWVELLESDTSLLVADADIGSNPDDSEPFTNRTVLYIEDNLASIQLIERLFSRWHGLRLLSAMQGSLGLDLASQHVPDLILLDLHLPDMHGMEVLERLRADSNTREIPIIITSADATPGQQERLLAAGANGYLTKPLDIPDFLSVVRDHLE
jgi:CheY-like chemotaxis protein